MGFTDIKMVIWLMNVDDRFCRVFGRMKIHKIPRISMSGVRRVLTDEFHGCVWKSGSSCHEETGRETGDQTVGSCRKHANTDLLGCSTLGQSSCIPLRTFRHRGSYKCTVVTAPTMIAQQKCGIQPLVLHDCQQKVPMFGKSLGMCLYFVCCLGFKRHDNKPQMDT